MLIWLAISLCSLISLSHVFWKLSCAPKFIYFSWLVFYNKNLSWENLRKIQWHGPSRCQMCKIEEESNFHMFFQCSSTQQIWLDLAFLYGFPLLHQVSTHGAHVSTHGAFDWWSRQKDSWISIIIIVLWCACRWRNNKIFNEAKEPLSDILHHIVLIYDFIPKKLPYLKNVKKSGLTDSLLKTPRAFFDGASHQSSWLWCGHYYGWVPTLQSVLECRYGYK